MGLLTELLAFPLCQGERIWPFLTKENLPTGAEAFPILSNAAQTPTGLNLHYFPTQGAFFKLFESHNHGTFGVYKLYNCIFHWSKYKMSWRSYHFGVLRDKHMSVSDSKCLFPYITEEYLRIK